MNFFYTKKFGIYFVATSRYNVSLSFVMDIIYRMMKVFRDYCGILNEESIRKNFVLIYEIIDEIIDYGHPQLVATENIRNYTVSDPIMIQTLDKSTGKEKVISRWNIFTRQTAPSTAISRPVTNLSGLSGSKPKKQNSGKNEIFVDIFEKLSVSCELVMTVFRCCSIQMDPSSIVPSTESSR